MSSPLWENPILPPTKEIPTLVDKPPYSLKSAQHEADTVSSSLRRTDHVCVILDAWRVSHQAERCAMLSALVVAYSRPAAARENTLVPRPPSWEKSKRFATSSNGFTFVVSISKVPDATCKSIKFRTCAACTFHCDGAPPLRSAVNTPISSGIRPCPQNGSLVPAADDSSCRGCTPTRVSLIARTMSSHSGFCRPGVPGPRVKNRTVMDRPTTLWRPR
mmetsp:Transcript_54695/g.129863  ORF Transcript_54695/g.129863 Transcript_54695/m.129863 type:complete len:218 (+) Transcript_54695:401-1054(+)